MNTYTIENAIINAGYGAKIDFSSAYVNDYAFHAESDEQAIEIAEKLQAEHDAVYRELGCTECDFENAPCYVSNLYRVDDDGELFKVEF